jgi:hypothetical protein
MSAPCNTQKISTSSIINGPNPRYSLPYVTPTPDMFLKHKQLILNHTTLTHGPGYIPDANTKTQVSYKLNIDSVQYKNIIYMIPCRFRPYIQLIQQLLNQNQNIQSIFDRLSTEYNIADPTLRSTDIYQFQRLYTYPQINYTTNKTLANNVNNAIQIPFKTGKIYDTTLPGININWSDYLPLPLNVFTMPQYCQFIQVINNLKEDNIPTYTSNFNNLYDTGSASYIGSTLITNLRENNFEITENNTTTKYSIRFINIMIAPQEQNLIKTFGAIVNTDDIPILKTIIIESQILFVPFQTVSSIMYYQPYAANMPFTIDTNSKIPEYKPQCTFIEPYKN